MEINIRDTGGVDTISEENETATNESLSLLRGTNAMIQVVRCFKNDKLRRGIEEVDGVQAKDGSYGTPSI